MRFVFLCGGLGNQIQNYIFLRYLEEETGFPVMFDDSLFHLAMNHAKHKGKVNKARVDDFMLQHSYELEHVFPNLRKPQLLSQYFEPDVWQQMIAIALEDTCPATSVARQIRTNILPELQVVVERGMVTLVLENNTLVGLSDEVAASFLSAVYSTPTHQFNSHLAKLSGDVYYHGIWYSPSFLEAHKPIILKELAFPEIDDAINLKYANEIKYSFSIGVHIRRRVFISDFMTSPESYYNEVITKLRSKHPHGVFFVFSNEISWCKENAASLGLPVAQTVFVEGAYGKPMDVSVNTEYNWYFTNNYIDMQLMSMCNVLVTSGASTFSRVASYLNQVDGFYPIHSWPCHVDDVAKPFTSLMRKLRNLPHDTVYYGAGRSMASILDWYDSSGISFNCEIWDVNADKIKEVRGHKVTLPNLQDKISTKRTLVVTIQDNVVAMGVADNFIALGWDVIIGYKDIIAIDGLMMSTAFGFSDDEVNSNP